MTCMIFGAWWLTRAQLLSSCKDWMEVHSTGTNHELHVNMLVSPKVLYQWFTFPVKSKAVNSTRCTIVWMSSVSNAADIFNTAETIMFLAPVTWLTFWRISGGPFALNQHADKLIANGWSYLRYRCAEASSPATHYNSFDIVLRLHIRP